MSSDSDSAPRTPAVGRRGNDPVSPGERCKKPMRKRGRGFTVLEDPILRAESSEQTSRAKRLKSLAAMTKRFMNDEVRALPVGFAEDFFRTHTGGGGGGMRLALTAKAANPEPVEGMKLAEKVDSTQFPLWLERMQQGFSVLLHGVGSKRRILDEFAKGTLQECGAYVVNCYCFHNKFSLVKLCQDVLATFFPGITHRGNSAESLCTGLRLGVDASKRPLCFVVHNLELLSSQHQRLLATLAATPNILLAASADSFWAPLAWDATTLKDFGFCRIEAHTFESGEAEFKARYPHGLPAWTGLGAGRSLAPRKSLSVVLRSLTNNHRELVQVVAERQLEEGGGRHAGISLSALLKEASDRLICNTLPKLRVLLNELRDHEVVIQKAAADGATNFHLPYDQRILERLRDEEGLSSSDEEGADLSDNADDADE